MILSLNIVAVWLRLIMNFWLVFLFPLACIATETEFDFMDAENTALGKKLKNIMDENNNDSIINFGLVKTLTGAVKNVGNTENEETFRIYLETANFDELFNDFSEKFHSAIEKRLNDALILK